MLATYIRAKTLARGFKHIHTLLCGYAGLVRYRSMHRAARVGTGFASCPKLGMARELHKQVGFLIRQVHWNQYMQDRCQRKVLKTQ